MTIARRILLAAAAAAALAGCAPDAVRRDREFEDWLAEVRAACNNARISTTTVGGLLGSTGSREGGNFLNWTSRLYAGQVTPEQWTSGVTAFISGRPTDPGVRCVLERLPPR
jgi:hypothetical protein